MSFETQLADKEKAATADKAGLAKQLAESQKAAAAEKEALTKQIAALQASCSDAAAQLTAQLAESQKAAAGEKEALEKQIAALQTASSSGASAEERDALLATVARLEKETARVKGLNEELYIKAKTMRLAAD